MSREERTTERSVDINPHTVRVSRVLSLSWKLWPALVAHFFQGFQTIGWGSLLLLSGGSEQNA